MLNSYSELDEQSYQQLRFDILVNVEESGNPKEEPYSDLVGLPTIGIGFNLAEGEVRGAVLSAFGFNAVNPSPAEQEYISDIETAAEQEYLTGTQAQRNASVQTALNEIMADWAADDSVSTANGNSKKRRIIKILDCPNENCIGFCAMCREDVGLTYSCLF